MMAKYLNYSTPVYAEFIGIIPIFVTEYTVILKKTCRYAKVLPNDFLF